MNRNSILLGRLLGIPIRVHIFLLIALPLFMTWFVSPNPLVRLLGVIGIFASVALHELGHSVVAQKKGSHIEEIVLHPLGGVAKISNLPSSPRDEIQIAVAGPAVSLLLGIVGIFVGIQLYLRQPEGTPMPLILQLGAINMGLFVFNLFPAFPMDGGRVFRAFLARRKGRVEATRIASQVGKYFCIFFVIYGLINAHLLLILIGVFIYMAGKAEYTQVLLQHQASHFSGFQENQLDVEVGPPPYAGSANSFETIKEKLRKLFRR